MSVELGAFELLTRVARGGMGEVWKGLHRGSGQPVAVKLMTGALASNQKFHDEFRREVQAMARLNHPNIVQIFDFGPLPDSVAELSGELMPGSPYLVMEFARQGSVHSILKTVDWDATYTILDTMLAALAHAHARGVIHRDIKPANILMDGTADAPHSRLMLTDFGIAHATDRQTRTASMRETSRSVEDASGTPTYMAPEQFMGRWRDYGPWTDLYALGAMAYQMVTGVTPFQGKTFVMLAMDHLNKPVPPMNPRFDVPAGFETWLGRMLAKQPARRFQHAADAREELARLEADAVVFGNGEEASEAEAATMVDFEPIETTKPVAFESRSFGVSPIETPDPPDDWKDASLVARTKALDGAGVGLVGLKTSPMTARESERDQLWKALKATCADSTPRAVVIEGGHGLGKTRLASWFAHLVGELGIATVFEASHDRSPGARHGLAWMLTSFYRCAGLSAQDMFARVEALLASDPESGELEVKALTEVMRSHIRDESESSGQFLRFTSSDQRHRQILRTLALEARLRPLVVVLDDAQWEQDTLNFVQFALQADPIPVLFVLTVNTAEIQDRPDASESLEGLKGLDTTETLELSSLSPEANIELLEAMGLPTDIASRVTRHARNQTLLALQIVQDWVDSQILRLDDGDLIVDERALADMSREGPLDLTSLWRSGVDRLRSNFQVVRKIGVMSIPVPITPDEVDRALSIAAVLGVDIDEEEWLLACEQDGLSRMPELLDRLAACGLGYRHETGFTWVNIGLVDELARDRFESRWKHANNLCARMLVSHYGSDHPGLPMRVARHFIEAHQFLFARMSLDEAYSQAFREGRQDKIGDVLDMLQVALDGEGLEDDAVARGHLYLKRAKTLIWGTDQDAMNRGLELMEKANSIATNRNDALLKTKVLAAEAWRANYNADLELAQSLANEGLQTAPNDAERAICHRLLGHMLQNMRHPHDAMQHFESCARLTEDPIDTFSAHLGLAQCLLDMGENERAAEHLDTASRLARKEGLLLGEALATETWGILETSRNAWPAAEERFRRALEIHQVLGPHTIQMDKVKELLTRALIPQERFDEARAIIRPIRERLDSGQHGFYMHFGDIDLAAAVGGGRWEDVDALIGEATTFDEFPPQVAHIRTLGWIRSHMLELGRDSKVALLDARVDALAQQWQAVEEHREIYQPPE